MGSEPGLSGPCSGVGTRIELEVTPAPGRCRVGAARPAGGVGAHTELRRRQFQMGLEAGFSSLARGRRLRERRGEDDDRLRASIVLP